MKNTVDNFIRILNSESDRRLLYGLTTFGGNTTSYSSCPLTSGYRTKFCSLDSFFRACVGIGKRTKTVGHSRTRDNLDRSEYCIKCKQLNASVKGRLVIDLAVYGIEIDESLMKKYIEGLSK